MAGPDRALPYRNQFWANTQKHTISAYHDRWLLLGATIGPDDELMIVRHDLSGLMDSVQTGATVASQTGLHINIKDTRDVVALKLTDDGGGAGDVIQEIDAAGVVGARLTSGGTFTNRSLAEFKSNMKDLTETQIEKILGDAKVYRFEYIKEPGIVYVSPEAAEFYKLTGFGDGTSMAPSTVGAIALRLVQWVYEKVMDIDKRLKAIETRLADDAPSV